MESLSHQLSLGEIWSHMELLWPPASMSPVWKVLERVVKKKETHIWWIYVQFLRLSPSTKVVSRRRRCPAVPANISKATGSLRRSVHNHIYLEMLLLRLNTQTEVKVTAKTMKISHPDYVEVVNYFQLWVTTGITVKSETTGLICTHATKPLSNKKYKVPAKLLPLIWLIFPLHDLFGLK